ncbi:alpha/beta fold hydrolase [Streptomyces sp. HUAS TT3]|uniref:alpha/beta hydrolase n=1 Tax=Streptomyces sp. HUAS TT3 TaxID=3447510 RepID=UPI003F658F60
MWVGRTAVVGAALVVLAGGAWGGARPAAAAGSAPGKDPAEAAAVAPFRQQRLAWHDCATDPQDRAGRDLDEAGARCTEATVPLDYRRPRGRTVRIALSRLPAADPARRRGALFYDPGGPGVPAMRLSLALRQAEPDLAARYDIVGVDPRFVGRSTPLDCGWPTAGVRAAGPDRAGFDRSAALARDLAERCAGHREVLPHASTRNTARDMDVVRAALGEPRLSYLGSSYGTYLGEVYLQLFPHRVDRAVLDSALDPDRFGPDLTRTQGPAMTAALGNWAAWAARHHDRYALGATREAVLATVHRVNTVVNRGPLAVGAHTVDSGTLPLVLWTVSAGDDDASYAGFSDLARALDEASRGLDPVPAPLLEAVLSGLDSPDAEGAAAAQNAVLCADRAASRDPEAYYRAVEAHRADEPIFGPLVHNLTPCTFWPASPAEPPTRVATRAPVLLVGADGDPAAPRAGQLAAHRALAGSRLVTLRGAFHHTVYGGLFAPRDGCVEDAVNRYLADGILPGRDLDCPAPTAG